MLILKEPDYDRIKDRWVVEIIDNGKQASYPEFPTLKEANEFRKVIKKGLK